MSMIYRDDSFSRTGSRDDTPHYFVGLDLGQAHDPTAIVVVERHGGNKEAVCHIPHMLRYPLGTPYPQIVTEVAERLGRAPSNTRLILDATGVGRPVVDLFRDHPSLRSRRWYIEAVTITSGDTETRESHDWRVPKRNLVGAVQVLLQTQRLKVAPNLPDTETLVIEMQNFKVKITAMANDVYGEWREGKHDDLVLAAALACWAAIHPTLEATAVVGRYYGI